MPRIRNWSRRQEYEDSETVRRWENDESNRIILIEHNLIDEDYSVFINKGFELTLWSKDFSNKEDAIDYAVDWMRNHSGGGMKEEFEKFKESHYVGAPNVPERIESEIRNSSDDFLLKAVDYPQTVMGLNPEDDQDVAIYHRIVKDELKSRGLLE